MQSLEQQRDDQGALLRLAIAFDENGFFYIERHFQHYVKAAWSSSNALGA